MRSYVQNDGCCGRVRIVLDVDLRKEVLHAPEEIKHVPQRGTCQVVRRHKSKRHVSRYLPISNIPNPEPGLTSISSVENMLHRYGIEDSHWCSNKDGRLGEGRV